MTNLFNKPCCLMKFQNEQSEAVFRIPHIPAVFPDSSCHCTAWAPGTSGLPLSVKRKPTKTCMTFGNESKLLQLFEYQFLSFFLIYLLFLQKSKMQSAHFMIDHFF